jgi:hypothetical protein
MAERKNVYRLTDRDLAMIADGLEAAMDFTHRRSQRLKREGKQNAARIQGDYLEELASLRARFYATKTVVITYDE